MRKLTSHTTINSNNAFQIRQLPSRTSLRRSALALLFSLAASFAFAQAQPLPSGATYELGFSPGGTALAAQLHLIAAAQHTLLIACYEYTSPVITRALIADEQRGVAVQVLADYKASLERYSLIPALIKSGIPVRRDSLYASEHHKFMVIDGIHVGAGSKNFTTASEKSNAEDYLVLYNVPSIAAQYAQEWQRLWNESR